ncbi:hypothetical protein C479_01291 [Halovivax asiaticus JCM 14624]|uniref:Uncharacterized protein n=1 Tax=Halovivax asiaticus JCM 14624 TaxID=1227490 RepID=M0BTK0_9EURY|nr:DUF5794 domain-containing protein [Halovivax asiaticus]ELZ13437.1 hypothetical protein C479_01291 [Halovivax asiaticus JCM 14624]
MSASTHPIARRLSSLGESDRSLLALVMGLPLIDGIFPALVLAGALENPLDAIQIGLLIFGGSATVAVVLGEMDGTPREQARTVLVVGIPLILIAALQAAIAPSIASVLDLVTFERFAALVIAAIAAKTASARIGEYLPGPGVIIALGLLASLDPAGATFEILADPMLVANALLAAGIGVGFALALAVFGPVLRAYVDVDRFRFGCALALGILPLSLLGMAFGQAPLAVLVVAGLFALDPDGEEGGDTAAKQPTASAGDRAHRTDGGVRRPRDDTTGTGEEDSPAEASATYDPYPSDDGTDTAGRAPWM